MGKLLFWIVVIVGALFVARLLAHHAGKNRAVPPKAPPRRSPPAAEPLPQMARCAHCGIHLPRAEALLLKGQTWCCEAHAALGPRPLD